jgi:hypothetical protein
MAMRYLTRGYGPRSRDPEFFAHFASACGRAVAPPPHMHADSEEQRGESNGLKLVIDPD